MAPCFQNNDVADNTGVYSARFVFLRAILFFLDYVHDDYDDPACNVALPVTVNRLVCFIARGTCSGDQKDFDRNFPVERSMYIRTSSMDNPFLALMNSSGFSLAVATIQQHPHHRFSAKVKAFFATLRRPVGDQRESDDVPPDGTPRIYGLPSCSIPSHLPRLLKVSDGGGNHPEVQGVEAWSPRYVDFGQDTKAKILSMYLVMRAQNEGGERHCVLVRDETHRGETRYHSLSATRSNSRSESFSANLRSMLLLDANTNVVEFEVLYVAATAVSAEGESFTSSSYSTTGLSMMLQNQHAGGNDESALPRLSSVAASSLDGTYSYLLNSTRARDESSGLDHGEKPHNSADSGGENVNSDNQDGRKDAV